jgi:hypothetical protein
MAQNYNHRASRPIPIYSDFVMKTSLSVFFCGGLGTVLFPPIVKLNVKNGEKRTIPQKMLLL